MQQPYEVRIAELVGAIRQERRGRTCPLPGRGSGLPLAEARFRGRTASADEHYSRDSERRRRRPH